MTLPQPFTLVSPSPSDQLLHKAASSDEEALVTAAWNFGYVFLTHMQDMG